MRWQSAGLGLAVLVSGCGGGLATQAAAPAEPRVPTPDELRRILPASLTPEQAARMLVHVPGDRVLLPIEDDDAISPSRRGGRGMGRGGRGAGFGAG
ncbi:MAG: hypothetical protein FJZ01_24985, partial [Candidatus Sericytochromatia bacterium]|nr:hypothetical protein [Candidatus Tanganyikabacteria bacterium]